MICLRTLSKLGQLHHSNRTSIHKSLPPLSDGLEPTLSKGSLSPMTHDGFSLLAQCDGVLITIICDNAKEQIMGKFCHKCREVGTCVKQTEPYTPWSNVAEGTIRELKCGAGCKMAKLSCPAKPWDHCLELEACIRLHTALDKYKLQG